MIFVVGVKYLSFGVVMEVREVKEVREIREREEEYAPSVGEAEHSERGICAERGCSAISIALARRGLSSLPARVASEISGRSTQTHKNTHKRVV